MALRTTIKKQLAGKSLPHPVKFGDWDTPKNTTANGEQVWLYIGDSLAQGTNQGTDTGPEPYYANSVGYWNNSTLAVNYVTTSDVVNSAAGSLWVKFGIDYYKRTGYKCVFVRNGKGGSTIYPNGDTNNWYDYVVQFGAAITETQNALTTLNLTEVRGVVILCGINDARNAQDLGAIRNAVFNLVDRINNRLKTPPVYFINIGRDENGTGRGQRVLAVDSYITEACNYYSNCNEILRISDYIADPFVYSQSFADVHPQQFGYDFLGAKAVRNMLLAGLISDTPRQYTYSAEALAVFSKLSNLTDEEKRSIADFVDYMTSKSEWTAGFDFFYLPLFKDPGNSSQCWIRSGKKFTGGAILTNRGGVRTDGVATTLAGRIMSNFTPSVDGVNYTQNNASIGAYVLKVTQTTGADHYLFSAGDASFLTHLLYSNTNSDKRFVVNSGSNGTRATGLFKTAQYYSIYRSASGSDNIVEDYTSSTHTFASSGLPTVELVFGARNNNGTFASGMKVVFGAMFGGKASASPNNYQYKKIRELVVDFLVMRD